MTDNNIFDLDGTLLLYDDRLHRHFTAMAIETVRFFVPALTPAQAHKMTVQAYRKYNDWTFLVIQKYGLDHDTLLEEFYKRLDPTVATAHAELPGQFAQLTHEQHAVLTHSNDRWAHGSLRHAGIKPHFPDQLIVTLPQYKVHKHRGPDGFKVVLDRMGATAYGTKFFDDTLLNFEHASRLGLTNIFMSAGRPVPRRMRRYVDHVEHDICAYMRKTLSKPAL